MSDELMYFCQEFLIFWQDIGVIFYACFVISMHIIWTIFI